MTEQEQDQKGGFTPQGWTMIIAAVFLGLSHMLEMYLGYQREVAKNVHDKAVDARVAEVSEKQDDSIEKQRVVAKAVEEVRKTAVEVKDTLDVNTAEHADKLESLTKNVNGLKDDIVKEVRESSFTKGAKSESDRQAESKKE